MDEQHLPTTPPTAERTAPPPTPVNPVNKPPLAVSDKDVQALLLVTNAAATPRPKANLHMKMVIAIAVLLLLVALTTYLLGGVGPGSKLKDQGSPQTSGQSNESSDRGINNEINQDVNSCSNPEVAISEC